MISLDFSPNRVSGGYFLCKANHRDVPYQWPQLSNEKQQFLGTYKCSSAPIRETLLDMLRNAKRKVFIAAFSIGDESLIQELLRTADRLQGGVYLITALSANDLRHGFQDFENYEEDFSPEERAKQFDRLTTRGIYVRGHENCHAKFAVVDDTIALVGSANFVRKAFDYTGEANLLVRDLPEVKQLSRLFTELWFEGCQWEIPPGEHYKVSPRSPETPPYRATIPSGEPGDIVWTNGPSQTHLLAAIQHTILAAERELIVSTYNVIGMTDHPELILNAVQQARAKGVEVQLFVRNRNAQPQQMVDLMEFHRCGVHIHGDTRNHAKLAIADRRQALLFSANLDASHGLTSGVEVGCCLAGSSVIGELHRYIRHAIDHADLTFVTDPLSGELDGRLASKWCRPWAEVSMARELTIDCDPNSLNQIRRESANGPCLFECDGSKVGFFVGRLCLRGVLTNNRVSKPQVSEVGPTSVQKLQSWISQTKESEWGFEKRGVFCGIWLVRSGK